jgi:DNA replication protein DnaC
MKCEAISHNRFSKTVQDAFSGERMDKGDARQILENLRRADVILFDDLGKPPSTERADSELEELLEHRTSHRKPTLWSANGGGRWIIQRLGPDRGAPLVRRLAEQGDVITVRK